MQTPDNDIKTNILISYVYMDGKTDDFLTSNRGKIRFILDSGAFTAWKKGTEISVIEYCNFIKGLKSIPDHYFMLDAIGDATKTKENYRIMLEQGLMPIPVFTRGESLNTLEEFYKTSEIVAIGGLVGTPQNKGFVKYLMKHIGSRKCHWLGFNAKEFIAHYRPYSCDSSSWSAGVRYALLEIYEGRGKWIRVTREDFRTRPPQKIIDILEKEYEFDPRILSQAGQWKNSSAGRYGLEMVAYKSWARYQIDLKKNLGVNFYIACTKLEEVKLILSACDFWLRKGSKGDSK